MQHATQHSAYFARLVRSKGPVAALRAIKAYKHQLFRAMESIPCPADRELMQSYAAGLDAGAEILETALLPREV
jgi:hypothetical protein